MNFPTSAELTCKDLIEFLAAYLEGELSARERSIFEGHLEICEACRDYLATYQKTIELAKESAESDQSLPAPPEELLRAILKSRH